VEDAMRQRKIDYAGMILGVLSVLGGRDPIVAFTDGGSNYLS
jgi:hypothetical protein